MMMPLVDELLIGESSAIRQLRELIVRIAPTSLPVLIEGPTGAGKEMVARALHAASGRPGEFVAFNVCAIADAMFEDALFGHVRGAFTGAMSDNPGYLRQAHQGTLFLDEVSGLSLANQSKLLRAIEIGEFRPVGATRDYKSDFRVVAASNQSLHQMSAGGSFREDLYHRFGKLLLRVPPLRERPEDIPHLVQHFLSQARPGAATRISDAAMRSLRDNHWPGNVRELKSAVESAAALSPGPTIDAADVAHYLSIAPQPVSIPQQFHLMRTLEVLAAADGNVLVAAGELGIHRSTLYRRLNRARLAGPP